MAPTAITLQLIRAQLSCELLGTQQHSAPSLGHNTCFGLECSHCQQSGENGGGLTPCPICCSHAWGLPGGWHRGVAPSVCSPLRSPLARGGCTGRAVSLQRGRAGATPPLPPSSSAAGRFAEVPAERGRSPSPPSRLPSAPGGAAVTRARPYKVPAPPRRRQSGAGASPERAPELPAAGAVPSPEPSPALPPWGRGVGRGGAEPTVHGLCPGPRSAGGSAAGARHRR